MQSSIADPLVQHQNLQQQTAGRRKPGSKQALFRSVVLALTILGSGVLSNVKVLSVSGRFLDLSCIFSMSHDACL